MVGKVALNLARQASNNILFSGVVLFSTLFLVNLSLAQAPDTLWTRLLGGAGVDYAFDFCLSRDGDIVIVGYEHSIAPNGQTYILRLALNGDTVWCQYYGYHIGMYPTAIIAGDDDCFFVTGSAGGATTIKFSSIGDTVWVRRFLPPDDADLDPHKLCRSREGGCTVVCRRFDAAYGTPRIGLLRYGDEGQLLWYRCYTKSEFDFPCGIQQTADGGYLVVSSTYDDTVNSTQIYLLRVNAEGDSLWARSIGGVDAESPQGASPISDGGMVIAGSYYHREDTMFMADAFAARVDSFGRLAWLCVFGGPMYDQFFAAEETRDGGFICAGDNSSDFPGSAIWLVKVSGQGSLIWNRGYTPQSSAYSIHQGQDGSYVAVGSGGGPVDPNGVVFRTAAEAWVPPRNAPGITSFSLRQNYPNPFNSKTTICYDLPKAGTVTVSVFDLLGNRVRTLYNGYVAAGTQTLSLDASRLPSGVYLCRLQFGDQEDVTKMVLVR